MSPGIELGTSRTEGRALITKCVSLKTLCNFAFDPFALISSLKGMTKRSCVTKFIKIQTDRAATKLSER